MMKLESTYKKKKNENFKLHSLKTETYEIMTQWNGKIYVSRASNHKLIFGDGDVVLVTEKQLLSKQKKKKR